MRLTRSLADLCNCHAFLGDKPVVDGASNELRLDLLLLVGSNAQIWIGLGIYLTQVYQAIFLGDKPDQVSPLRRHDDYRILV